MEHITAEEARERENREYRRKWYSENRDIALARARKWREDNPERHKMMRLKWKRENAEKDRNTKRKAAWKRAGIANATIIGYEDIYREQGGICAICGNPPKTRNLAWDHNHLTGQARGLLCGGCNVRLGWLEKLYAQVDWFHKADAYLNKW